MHNAYALHIINYSLALGMKLSNLVSNVLN